MLVAYAVLVSTMMPYVVTVYGMMSLIQNQPVWRQRSEGEDPEALSLSSSLCAAPVDLLDPPHFTMWSGWKMWAATGFSVFLVLMSERCLFILMCRVFSVSLTYCRPHFLHDMR